MSAPRVIPDALIKVQIEASDPAVSAWVAANAGSGKTYVLAQRVIRLLLAGVDPAKILCVTFTKAAAANMANRVFDTLAEWTALDDAQLDEAIRRVSNLRPKQEVRGRARKLFAIALDTPGGLKVQTIHALCTRLLHQFPFEANVAARFTVLDEASEAQLLERTTLNVLLDATKEPDGALGQALASAITSAADQTFKDVVAEAIRKRDGVGKWIERTGSVEAAVAELCALLRLDPADTLEAVDAEIVDGPHLPSRDWPSVAATLATGSKSDQSQGDRLTKAAAATGSERAQRLSRLLLHWRAGPAQVARHRGVCQGKFRSGAPAERRTGPRRQAVRPPQHRRLPRPHPRAAHHRARGDLALPRREGPARAARLRRPDRQDAGAAWRGSRRSGCTTSSTTASITC